MTKGRRIRALRAHRDNALASAKHMARHYPELTEAIASCIAKAWLEHRALMIELRA